MKRDKNKVLLVIRSAGKLIASALLELVPAIKITRTCLEQGIWRLNAAVKTFKCVRGKKQYGM